MKATTKILLNPFCEKQFDATKTKCFINLGKEEFAEEVNKFYISNKDKYLIDGYAPFCKHLFIPNFIQDLKPNYLPITPENENSIRTCYEARTDKELPVLKRFIPFEAIIGDPNYKPAKFIDVILYSKDQIFLENQAMGNADPDDEVDYDYGIICVKPQDCDYELPMDPITMMRNALGVEHGGSGVPLDRIKYLESVEFWSTHVLLK